MAEKERVALNDTIDYTKMLTELSIGSSYIFALEQLMMYHIIRLDNPGETPLIFAKFEKYVTSYVVGGSLTTGTAKKDSDVDVFVIIDDTDVKRMPRM